MESLPKTIFCDIDGTLVRHLNPSELSKKNTQLELLDGTIEKLLEWEKKGYKIILTTGRKKSLRSVTEKQLSEIGIFYDELLMEIGGGERILINDNKKDGTITARCFNLERNKGIKAISL
jgi:histidinol phosphatase-like enzyme